jgi:hypothetical protein
VRAAASEGQRRRRPRLGAKSILDVERKAALVRLPRVARQLYRRPFRPVLRGYRLSDHSPGRLLGCKPCPDRLGWRPRRELHQTRDCEIRCFQSSQPRQFDYPRCNTFCNHLACAQYTDEPLVRLLRVRAWPVLNIYHTRWAVRQLHNSGMARRNEHGAALAGSGQAG